MIINPPSTFIEILSKLSDFVFSFFINTYPILIFAGVILAFLGMFLKFLLFK